MGLSIKELRGLGLFLRVRRSVGADSVMHYDRLVKMLDPANLNSVFMLFRSECFTNNSHKACLFGHCLAHWMFPCNYGFPETLTSKVTREQSWNVGLMYSTVSSLLLSCTPWVSCTLGKGRLPSAQTLLVITNMKFGANEISVTFIII